MNTILNLQILLLKAEMPKLLTDVLDLIKNFAMVGGGLWLVWGVIVLAGGLKDHNGPALKSGIWQIIGGAMIIGAAALFAQVTKIDEKTSTSAILAIISIIPRI